MNNGMLLAVLVIITLAVFTLNNGMDLFWKVKGTIQKIKGSYRVITKKY